MSRDQLERRITEARATIYQLSGWPGIHRPAVDDLLNQIDLARRELDRRWPAEPAESAVPTDHRGGPAYRGSMAMSGKEEARAPGRASGPIDHNDDERKNQQR